ncbi:MAG: helix-turn-helix domain-containing protein [Pseudomonadota bacterium]
MFPIGVHSEAEAVLCPIRMILSKVTGKWQIIIVLCLEDGPMRFAEIKRTVGDITQRVLTENLRSLERDGHITRTVFPGPPIAVSYQLTERGRAFVEALKPVLYWSANHLEPVKASRAAYDAEHAK